MTYKFYVQMEGQSYGPYSVKELMGLGLLDDTLITEESMNGEWLPARRFDFEDMLQKEQGGSQPSIAVPPGFTNPPTQNRPNPQSTSFTPTIPATPSIIGKWNWGAFWFNWIWGVFNGVYWPLWLIVVNLIPYVGWIVSLGACIYLGMNGSEQAWKGKKHWASVAEFETTQKNWSIAVLWVLGIIVVLSILVGIASAS